MTTTGDPIIDAGNSRFTDTDHRMRFLEDSGLLFMGMGISGGAPGARNGPSLMDSAAAARLSSIPADGKESHARRMS